MARSNNNGHLDAAVITPIQAPTTTTQNDNPHALSRDKTNYCQSLMHMIKGNLGTGILAMPSTFALCTLLYGSVGLPLLCLVATCCVHLLVRSSQHLETKIKLNNLEYSELAKGSFKAGPRWLRSKSRFMCNFVDAILIISQIGICCVYIVFVVDNLKEILASRRLDEYASEGLLYFIALAIILPVSYIRTLRALSFVSGAANVLQVIGITVTVYLLVSPDKHEQASVGPSYTTSINSTLMHSPAASHHNNIEFNNNVELSKIARGFGAAMFAFEGISVVLPIYSRMKRPEQMGGTLGTINVSYALLLVLYTLVGVTGYLKYGDQAKGSISQNLQRGEMLPDMVRSLFVISLLLTYPLQFYVPNEIIWNWARSTFIERDNDNQLSLKDKEKRVRQYAKYEYICRTILVFITFVLAISIKKLRLLMELVGAISGTALSIILPPMIHLATFWEDTSGISKAFMIVIDSFFIMIGLIASASGSFFSTREIIEKWHEP